MSEAGSGPPSFLQLAGHPLRWQLLQALSAGDRRVHELTAMVGEPQNVVSYHLAKLREAELVSARRSSADRRDTYYRVHLDRIGSQLAATGPALHPGLRLTKRMVDARVASGARVLFLCTGNSARSQIAEALTVARSGGAVEAHSAGSDPKPLHPNAIRVMREVHGIDLRGARSKHLDEFAHSRFDRVITLCDRLREACPDLPGAPVTHWSIPDPSAGGDAGITYPSFRAAASELEIRIGFLLAELEDSAEPIPA